MTSLFERHDLKGKIFSLLDELFGQTYLNKNEVTQVKTFGGTSRVKYVLDLLTEYFGTDIFDSGYCVVKANSQVLEYRL